jgi:hypothetical protein
MQAFPGLRLVDPVIPLYLVDSFLSSDEVLAFRDAALTCCDMQQSKVLLENGDGDETAPIRSSMTGILSRTSFQGNLLLQRVSQLLGMPVSTMETPQLVHYRSDRGPEFYRPHYDPMASDSMEVQLRGQRVVTVLVYLNSLPWSCGGHTSFPKRNVSIAPTAGTAVVFFPSSRYGVLNTNALHSADVLTPDHPDCQNAFQQPQWAKERRRTMRNITNSSLVVEKLAAQVWIRNRLFTPY